MTSFSAALSHLPFSSSLLGMLPVFLSQELDAYLLTFLASQKRYVFTVLFIILSHPLTSLGTRFEILFISPEAGGTFCKSKDDLCPNLVGE
jgi:hypothetical protein